MNYDVSSKVRACGLSDTELVVAYYIGSSDVVPGSPTLAASHGRSLESSSCSIYKVGCPGSFPAKLIPLDLAGDVS